MIYAKWEKDKSIHISQWPELFGIPETAKGQMVVDIISSLRRWKSDKGLPLNRALTRVKLYTSEEVNLEDIKGAMNIKKIEITTENPAWKEKISQVAPDFKVIGPLFGKDTNKVAALLKEHAEELEEKKEIKVKGFTLRREYITSVEKEFYAGEKKVEVLSSGEVTIEVEIE